jgi:hypothetical protein
MTRLGYPSFCMGARSLASSELIALVKQGRGCCVSSSDQVGRNVKHVAYSQILLFCLVAFARVNTFASLPVKCSR